MSRTRRKRYEISREGVLEPHQRILCLLGPLALGFLFVAAMVVRPLALQYNLIAPFFEQPCVFQSLSGLPCPFCGLTRATVAAWKGRWLLAVLYHPLGVVLVGGGGAVAAWLTACAALGRDLGLSWLYRLLNRRSVLWICLGFLALLWARQVWVALYVWPLPAP